MLMLFLLVIAIAIPLLITLVSQDTKMTVKTKNQTVAYQLASAGVDRSVWMLKATMANWNTVLSTGYITGYNNDTVYNDVNLDNGYYRVRITSVTADELQVVSTAKDSRALEYRAITARVRRTQVVAPLHGYNIGASTIPFQAAVHWGPIIATSQLILSSIALNQLYPVKYSATTITQSSGVYASRVPSASSIHTDGTEYYAYNNVYPIPTPDLEYYIGLAQTAGTYYTTNQTFNNVVDVATDTVRYIDGANCTISGTNSFLQGTLIVLGNLSITGNRTTGGGNYTVPTPPNAWQQYGKNTPSRKGNTTPPTGSPPLAGQYGPDSTNTGEYPGDNGLHTVTNFTFGNGTCPTCEANGRRVAFRGAIYVSGNLSGATANPQVVHGAVILPKGATTSTGWFEIFYDTATTMQTTTQGIYVSTWTETLPVSF